MPTNPPGVSSYTTSAASHSHGTPTPKKIETEAQDLLSKVYPVDLYMVSSPSLLQRIEDDPTRCVLRDPTDIYTQEKLRMASMYLNGTDGVSSGPLSVDKGLLLIEQLLTSGEIGF
jgi:hypothetical protein